jgi:hypothetical protein
VTALLLDTDHDIIAAPVDVMGFADCQLDGFFPVLAMAKYPALKIDHIPPIEDRVMIHMKGMF